MIGRFAGRWIPARVIKTHPKWRTVDLIVPNNHMYQVSKYAIHVPLTFVRKPSFRFKVGDRICTKILRGRKEGVWIPAQIIRVNEDGTYDLYVDRHKSLQVTKYAVHVPEQYLRSAKNGIPDPNTPTKRAIPSIISPVKIPFGDDEKKWSLKKAWEKRKKMNMPNLKGSASADVPRSRSPDKPPLCLDRSSIVSTPAIPNMFQPLEVTNKVSKRKHHHISSDNLIKNEYPKSVNIKPLCSSIKPPQNNGKKFFTKSRHGSKIQEALPSASQLGLGDLNETFSVDKKTCPTKQQQAHDTEHSGKHRRNKSNMSDWDHFFNSESSDDHKEEPEVESIHSEADWDEGPEFKDEQSTPRFPGSSGMTSPGHSIKGSSDLDKSEKLAVCKNDSRKSYEFVDSFISSAKRRQRRSTHNRIVTIGVSKHRIQFNEMGMDTPLEQVASWLSEGAQRKGKFSSVENLVNNISFQERMIPIRSNFGGSISGLPAKDHQKVYSLGDVLGKSLDASTQGLAFFVGPVDGRMSYKMSVLDVDQIHRARAESAYAEIREDEEMDDDLLLSSQSLAFGHQDSAEDLLSDNDEKIQHAVAREDEKKMDDFELLPIPLTS